MNNSAYKSLRIREIVQTISLTHNFDKDKLIAINTSDVYNGVMGKGTLTPVEELKGQFKKTIQKDDILFSEIRPANRRFAIVTNSDCSDFVVSTKLMVLRKFNEKVDSSYFYYCLTNQPFLDILQRRAENRIGSFPQITYDLLANYAFPIPPLKEQERISKIIANIDRKIELNRQINDNLEQQAQALFKSWFVDFEPFRGGEFVDSELGLIPKGWRVVSLGEVTKQITEKVGNREDVTVLSPINSGKFVLSEEYFTKQVFSKDLSKYLIVNPLSFAYNPARINIGSIGLNTFDFVGCVSPVYVVFECEPNYQYFFDFFKRTAMFKDEVALRAIGGVRQSLGYNDLSLIKTIYPTSDVVVEFNNLYLKMKEVMIKNTDQNEKFISLRDSLLPKPMSGELKINEFNC